MAYDWSGKSHKQYDPQTEGYGNATEWSGAFRERLVFEEATRILYGTNESPRVILGLPKTGVSWAMVIKAFKNKAMATHPDRATINGMTKTEAEQAFKKVHAAYSVLAREFGE